MTSQSASRNSQLQVQSAQLQKKLNERDAQITSLKQEVETLSQTIKDLEGEKYASDSDDNFIEYKPYQASESFRTGSSSTKTTAKKSSSSSSKSNDIVRVDVNHKTVQTALKNAGYYAGSIDGKIGSKSKQAINDFQKDHELKVDGIIGRQTWSELKVYLD